MISTDKEKIISAAIYFGLLILMNYGFKWAAYIAVGVYALQIVLLIFAFAIIIQKIYSNSEIILDEGNKEKGRKIFGNPILNILLHVLSGILIVNLYLHGFAYVAGFASVLVAYGLAVNLYMLIAGVPR